MTEVWATAALFVLGCAGVCGQTHPRPARAGASTSAKASASTASVAISAATSAALGELAGRAAIIFAGHVLSITRQDEAGFVDIKFKVDAPVRGGSRLGTYVLREWAGLWSGSPARYRVGQRYLMLLSARGPSGISAPVGGSEGILPISGGIAAPIADARGVAPAEDGTDGADLNLMTVDLRWVGATATRLPVAPAEARGQANSSEGAWIGAVAPLSSVSGTDTVALPTTVGTVLTLLRGASSPVVD